MKVLEYRGEAPKVLDPEDRKEIMKLMLAQLDVLKMMARSVVLIPEGTRLKSVHSNRGEEDASL